jgi:hypothetical protein
MTADYEYDIQCHQQRAAVDCRIWDRKQGKEQKMMTMTSRAIPNFERNSESEITEYSQPLLGEPPQGVLELLYGYVRTVNSVVYTMKSSSEILGRDITTRRTCKPAENTPSYRYFSDRERDKFLSLHRKIW